MPPTLCPCRCCRRRTCTRAPPHSSKSVPECCSCCEGVRLQLALLLACALARGSERARLESIHPAVDPCSSSPTALCARCPSSRVPFRPSCAGSTEGLQRPKSDLNFAKERCFRFVLFFVLTPARGALDSYALCACAQSPSCDALGQEPADRQGMVGRAAAEPGEADGPRAHSASVSQSPSQSAHGECTVHALAPLLTSLPCSASPNSWRPLL